MRAEGRPGHESYHDENTTRPFLHLPRTVVMTGMMGVGKSVVGRQLAARLQVPFVDADSAMEAMTGCSLATFFARYGEKAFRESEHQMMAHLLAGPVCVLSSGGGAFMDPRNRAVIKAQAAVSVWLKANLEILVSRTAGSIHRPLLLQGNNPRTVLARLLEERSPVYATADVIVESTDGPCEKIVEHVAAALAYHFDVSAESAS
ncbi:Shikimate kinase I |uniref:shikimate kinase n=1 Tax=invertebrate metagenome TaxID=1711999 RepID=A0A484H8R9_9ZZZZ